MNFHDTLLPSHFRIYLRIFTEFILCRLQSKCCPNGQYVVVLLNSNFSYIEELVGHNPHLDCILFCFIYSVLEGKKYLASFEHPWYCKRKQVSCDTTVVQMVL